MSSPYSYSLENLEKLSVSQLKALSSALRYDISDASQHLVHGLVQRDVTLMNTAGLERRLTDILIHYALHYNLDADIQFSLNLTRLNSNNKYHMWLNGWMVVCRIGKGIPKRFRKRVWATIAAYHTQSVQWDKIMPTLFRTNLRSARDNAWMNEIDQSAHLVSKYASVESIKRVLLAYSRHNALADFTPELCPIASLLLKALRGDEVIALKILVYILDYQLPPAYFSNELISVNANIAVVDDLLFHIVPALWKHLENLRTMNSCKSIKKSYSYIQPPNHLDMFHEPHLINPFVLQWFLLLYTNCLSWNSLRRLFDAIMVYGLDMIVCSAVAIWGIYEKEILDIKTVPDYYVEMPKLLNELKNSNIISSANFMMVVYSVYDIVNEPYVPSIAELRQKHIFSCLPANIGDMVCPMPSQGGSLLITLSPSDKITAMHRPLVEYHPYGVTMVAKAECPQVIRRKFIHANAYGADVPEIILSRYTMDVKEEHMKMIKEGVQPHSNNNEAMSLTTSLLSPSPSPESIYTLLLRCVKFSTRV